MPKWFRLTSRNSGDIARSTFELECRQRGKTLLAITICGVDPCTALAAKEAGFEWHAASKHQTREVDGLVDVPPSRAYAIFFPVGHAAVVRVQEYFGDVAAENGNEGSMSLLEWLVLMQVIPTPAASKALNEWTAAWRVNKKAPEDTLALCWPDSERLTQVLASIEAPLLVTPPVKYAGPPTYATTMGQAPPVFPMITAPNDEEDDPFEAEDQ